MSSRLTLVFVCNQSYLYSRFIDEFRAAGFQVLIARSLTQARSILLTRSVAGSVLCHDCSRDDRSLAAPLKGLAPHLPVFLLTDREQSLPASVDCIWRSELGDEAATRGMAVFFRHIFSPREESNRPSLVVGSPAPFFVGVRANGSS